ncbi:MAG TPA: hypothetical protein VIV60_07060 [Polyangiaceae bacterium]
MSVVELVRGNFVAAGLTSNTLVIYYEQSPCLAGARAIEGVANRIGDSLERLTILVAIDGGSRPPEPAVREVIQRTMRQFESKMDGLAYSIHAEGFKGAAARAAVSGILMIVKPKYPTKVFANIPVAMSWLYSQSRGRTAVNRKEETADIERFCMPQSANSGPSAVKRAS